MKMGMTRVQAIMDHADAKVMLNLSMQAAKDLSQTLQACGIRSIRLATVETMGEHTMHPAQVDYFDGVPDAIAKWTVPAIDGIAALMAAFGISSISFEHDENDARDLARNWRFLVNDGAQLRQVRAMNPSEGQSRSVAPRPPMRGAVSVESPLQGRPFGAPSTRPDEADAPKEHSSPEDAEEITEIAL